VSVTVKVMGFTRKSKHIVWISDQFDMPLRTQGEDGSRTELRNIKKGRPSAAVFKTPEGYRQVSSMMEVMGMEFPTGGNGDGDTRAVEDADEGSGKMPFNLPEGLKQFKLPFGKKE